eukprot:CAMPEP_0114622206 /NCGR_PEP_ID=MMETSP0168-20121206/9622_1 /TAXON_ID=95228 ORGANISM="Vannella sp., Strain DIVA3 517/6/12" /NCGR_SAMPLE_ID=MMETSP0168 /ASSEMBLY_ACC=CAM_ASM_000044 /LENGTH=109 /DNA_ID=CAMNT_0001833423 /DNA_START=42 /DNA_END=371 /DNA_ORIENTATION=+
MSFTVQPTKGFARAEPVQSANGVCTLASDGTGIANLTLSFGEGRPEKVVLCVQGWKERLEGLRAGSKDVRQAEGCSVAIADGVLTVTLEGAALADVQDGAALQLVDFFR